MSFERKFKRSHGAYENNKPYCCGHKMLLKESHGVFVCQCCGKEKPYKPKERENNG